MTRSTLSHQNQGVLQLAIAMMISGSIGYVVILGGQPSWNTVFFRCLFGALFLSLYLCFKGQWQFKNWDRSTLIWALGGGLALIGNWVLLFWSFEFIAFSLATVAYHMQPLFLVIAGAWLLKERVGMNTYLWLAIAFAGLGFILQIDSQLFDSHNWLGVTLALGAGVLYTIATLAAKKTAHLPPALLATLQISVGIILLAPFVDTQAITYSQQTWTALITLGVLHTGVMYILLYSGFQKLNTSLIAVLSFIYPLVALLLDHLAFDTLITGWQGLGITLILAAATGVKLEWRVVPGVKKLEVMD